MDRQIQRPDYIKIYSDIIDRNFPEKREVCKPLLTKGNLYSMEILLLNKRIFGTAEKDDFKQSQRHCSYIESDILQILDYQKKYQISNKALAEHFNLSRNTVTKWRKIFL